MAKLPALVSALSEVDGREHKTLDHVARVIREAGHIPTTKRGSGASEMTAREAANLLMALNGAEAPKDGPAAIERLRSLRFWYSESDIDGEPELEVLKAISSSANFGDALEMLIDGMPDVLKGAFAFIDAGYERETLRTRYKEGLFKFPWNNPPLRLLVKFEPVYAEIELSTWVDSPHGPRWRTDYRAKFSADADLLMQGFYGGDPPDRAVSVRITGLTLVKLWLALHSAGEHSTMLEGATE